VARALSIYSGTTPPQTKQERTVTVVVTVTPKAAMIECTFDYLKEHLLLETSFPRRVGGYVPLCKGIAGTTIGSITSLKHKEYVSFRCFKHKDVLSIFIAV
jgi:hypothetical protein